MSIRRAVDVSTNDQQNELDETVESSITADQHFTIVPNNVIAANISDRAFRTYAAIRAYLREGHATFPKISTVGDRFGLSESYLKRGIKELQEVGILIVGKRHFSGGFRRVNEYHFPAWIGGGKSATPEAHTSAPGSSKSDPPASTPAMDPPGVANLTPRIEEEKYEEEKYELKNHAPDGAEGELEDEPPSLVAAGPSDFDVWWAAYPNKRDKKAAARAYTAARKRTDADTLLAGADAYAAEVKGREKSKIKHGSTWLNGDCWENYSEAEDWAVADEELPPEWRQPKPMPDHVRAMFENAGEL